MTDHASVTVLVDNHAGQGLGSEHGLSYWIETPSARIVFDTGQSGMLLDNARALGIDLARTDFVVVSHGHYDHTGGLEDVMRLAPDSTVYCHPGAAKSRFARHKGGMKPVGMSAPSRKALENLGDGRLVMVDGPMEIAPGVWISGPIPRRLDDTPPHWPFFLDEQATKPDPIEDDMCMWIDSRDGLVVLLGCCHSGLAETLAHVRACVPGGVIHTLAGGLHLMDSGAAEIEQVLDILSEASPRIIAPLHCTGELATSMLRDRFTPAVTPGHSGLRLTAGM